MSTATANAAAAFPCWRDHPFDLLHDISNRLHTSTDYVRLQVLARHASSAILRPNVTAMAPRSERRHRPPQSSMRLLLQVQPLGHLQRVPAGDELSLARPPDASSPTNLTTAGTNPLAGFASSIALPPYPDEMKSWVKRATSMVTGDGTVFLYALRIVQPIESVVCAHLHGAPASFFTQIGRWSIVAIYTSLLASDSCRIAYHYGANVQCCGSSWHVWHPLLLKIRFVTY